MSRWNLAEVFTKSSLLLMEGALGERLKREYHIAIDGTLAMAPLYGQKSAAAALGTLWREYAAAAAEFHLPLLLTTPTRRLNRERVQLSRVDGDTLAAGNAAMLSSLAAELSDTCGIPVFCGALMGCRGDAYTGEGALDADAAYDFHAWAAERFARAGVQFLYAGIMPTLSETCGMARAMAQTGLPYLISFTIRRDGCLIDGTPIADAVAVIDDTVGNKPLCYMTNCVHPTILSSALSAPCNDTAQVRSRFLGIQANTSPLSYDQLDGAAELHTSEPEEMAEAVLALRQRHGLKLFGGCCGTDARHLRAMAQILVNEEIRNRGE